MVTRGWVAVALWYLLTQFVSPDRPQQPEPAEDAAADPAAEREPEADGATDVPEEQRVQWLPPALLAATLCGYLALLEPLGFVLPSTVFFVTTARILGSRKLVRDIVAAVALALAVFLAFTRLLELHLPSGVLPL